MVDHVIARAPGAGFLPRHWGEWSAFVRAGRQPSDIGLRCVQSHLNRFAARYRAARALGRVELEGYSDVVRDGYASLFRLFFAWTAFDQYLTAIPCEQAKCLVWVSRHTPSDLQAQVRQLDPNNRLFNLICAKTRGATFEQIRHHINGDEINWTYLASSLRHIFAHGILTPSANGVRPGTVGAVCQLLVPHVLTAVDGDFSMRVEELRQRTK